MKNSSIEEIHERPIFFSPLVFDLISLVNLPSANMNFNIEGMIYQASKLQITVQNLLGIPANCKMIIKISRIIDEFNKNISTAKTFAQEVQELLSSNTPPSQDTPIESTTFEEYLNNHIPFVFSHKEVNFPAPSSNIKLDIDFNPIRLGTYRCIVLFTDESSGEFVYEIIAKSTVPSSIDANNLKMKAEAGKNYQQSLQIEFSNPSLLHALAYSIQKLMIPPGAVNEGRLKDLILKKQREIELISRESMNSIKFSVTNSSPQFFFFSNEFVIKKQTESNGKPPVFSFPIEFKPLKPGDYPCKLIFLSPFDIRCFQFKGQGIAATKEISLEFHTHAGKSTKQDIPLLNTSDDIWNFKISVVGEGLSAPPRVSVKPKTTGFASVTYLASKQGRYTGEIQVFNLNKESNLVYKVFCTVEEPPAEEKIVFSVMARKKIPQSFKFKPFVKNGLLNVTSTIPIATHPQDIMINEEEECEFTFEIYASRSGFSAGTFTFTDPISKNFIWYIIEIQIEPPEPEQEIPVNTIVRKSSTVNIPLTKF